MAGFVTHNPAAQFDILKYFCLYIRKYEWIHSFIQSYEKIQFWINNCRGAALILCRNYPIKIALELNCGL